MNSLRALTLENEDVNYTAVAFAAMKRTVRPGLIVLLKENGDYADLLQDARLAACEAWQAGLSARDAYNLASRNVYAGMKALGYNRRVIRRGKSGDWERRTVGIDKEPEMIYYSN